MLTKQYGNYCKKYPSIEIHVGNILTPSCPEKYFVILELEYVIMQNLNTSNCITNNPKYYVN